MSGPAPVDDHRLQADVLEQHHVGGEVVAQRLLGHRRAAVLDHHRAPVEVADVGQRLEQGLDRRRHEVHPARPEAGAASDVRGVAADQGFDAGAEDVAGILCRVLRVDAHVLVREVGEVHVRGGFAAAQPDLDLRLRVVAGQRFGVDRLRARAPRAPRRRAPSPPPGRSGPSSGRGRRGPSSPAASWRSRGRRARPRPRRRPRAPRSGRPGSLPRRRRRSRAQAGAGPRRAAPRAAARRPRRSPAAGRCRWSTSGRRP